MTLKRIVAQDFCSFEEINQPLEKRGLVWLGGDNRDTKAAGSNGGGKTSFFKAISWGLFGQTIDGADGDAVIREGQKEARVTIQLSDNFHIVRTRRKGQPKIALYQDASLVPGGKDETQASINRLVGMDFGTFRNVVLYGQRDMQRFIAPDAKDSDRKEVLQAILRTQIYAKTLEFVKSTHLALKTQITELSNKLQNCEARIEECDIDSRLAESKAWAAKNAEDVERVKSVARDALSEARTLTEGVADIGGMERRLEELKKQQEAGKALERERIIRSNTCRAFEANVRELETKHRIITNNFLQKKNEGEKFRTGTCPVCTSPTDSGHAKEHVLKLRNEAMALQFEVQGALEALKIETGLKKGASEAHDEIDEKIRALPDYAQAIYELRSELQEALSAKEKAGSARSRAKGLIQRAKDLSKEPNPFDASIKMARARLADLWYQSNEHKNQIESKEKQRLHYDFWQRGFGPSGLPSFVLDSIMPYLTERTNHYLETLSDGDITVNFTTQSELKSSKGEVRDKIGIFWTADGMDMKPLSGGQFKRAEIATTLAMMDLCATREGATIDLLLIDEAMDGLDEEGRARTMDLLHKLRTVRKSIFVISHEKDVGEIFERALIVIKENGVSKIENAS